MQSFSLFIIALMFLSVGLQVQTATICRSGVALSPVHSSIVSAALAAKAGDSMLLSAHTFREYGLLLPKGPV